MRDFRAKWISPQAQLTRPGEILADFMPRVQRHSWPSGGWCWRVYGVRKFYRFCLFDLTVYDGAWCISVAGLSVSNKRYKKFTGRAVNV